MKLRTGKSEFWSMSGNILIKYLKYAYQNIKYSYYGNRHKAYDLQKSRRKG